MTNADIERIVKSYLEASKGGMSVENPKFDFKREWYRLNDKKGINAFLKDTSAIANTFGPDGCIVIGYDDKTKQFHSSKFSDCGLSDSNLVNGIISKGCDQIFALHTFDTVIDGQHLSLIHIPPSVDKPHLVRNHQTYDQEGNLKKEEQHRIFVRRGTSSEIATKHEIELMYYDRKNILPEYQVSSYLSLNTCYFESIVFNNKFNGIRFRTHLTIENTGRRPIAIVNISFGIELFYDEKYNFSTNDLTRKNILVSPGNIWTGEITFLIEDSKRVNENTIHQLLIDLDNKHIKGSITAMSLTLMTGSKINCQVGHY
jgi:hypothetical protein